MKWPYTQVNRKVIEGRKPNSCLAAANDSLLPAGISYQELSLLQSLHINVVVCLLFSGSVFIFSESVYVVYKTSECRGVTYFDLFIAHGKLLCSM